MADMTKVTDILIAMKSQIAQLEAELAAGLVKKRKVAKKVEDAVARRKLSDWSNSLQVIAVLMREILGDKKMPRGHLMKVASYMKNNKIELTLETVKEAMETIKESQVPAKTRLKVFYYEDNKKIDYFYLPNEEVNVYLTATENLLSLLFAEQQEWMFDDGHEEGDFYILHDLPANVVQHLDGKKFQLMIFSSRHKYEVGFE